MIDDYIDCFGLCFKEYIYKGTINLASSSLGLPTAYARPLYAATLAKRP
jgi:hypothetical protein